MFLAGDIGGTNTRLWLASYQADQLETIYSETYASQKYADFNTLLQIFLDNAPSDVNIEAACFGVAGPVENAHVNVTNLPWHIDVASLQILLACSKVSLINDFIAVAHGVKYLQSDDILSLKTPDNTPSCQSSMSLVIGAGTGLGAALRIASPDCRLIVSSETGHAGFPVSTQQQCELLQWQLQQEGCASIETFLSGPGIYRLYRFVKSQHVSSDIVQASVVDETIGNGHADPAAIICEAAIAGTDAVCVQAIELFCDIYASVCASIALHHYPVSQVYIAGGIAPRLVKFLNTDRFRGIFTENKMMAGKLDTIQVYLVMDTDVGLTGAMYVAIAS